MGALQDIAAVARGEEEVKIKVGIEMSDALRLLASFFFVSLLLIMIEYNMNKKLKS